MGNNNKAYAAMKRWVDMEKSSTKVKIPKEGGCIEYNTPLLTPGKHYYIAHRNTDGETSRFTRRIYLYSEKRFPEAFNIECYVFTSRAYEGIEASITDKVITITAPRGKRIPRKEISIPCYELIMWIPAEDWDRLHKEE